MILLVKGGLLLEEKPGTTSQITNNQKPFLPQRIQRILACRTEQPVIIMFSNEKFGVRGYLRWSLLLKSTVTKNGKIITRDPQQIYSPINENGFRLD
jgi:hypothetical protein